MSNEQIYLREDPARRDLIARTIQVRSATLNEEERSVEAVLATETPAFVFDMRSWDVIEEVLIVKGANLPQQLPLLATHDRWSLESVLGSWRNIRIEGEQIVGRMFFAKNDPAADSAWNKVRQGHLTDVSVGYVVKNSVDIPAGQTQTINGRQFTAKTRTLRVSTEWTPKEGSLVPIGADPSAKTRQLGTTSLIPKEEKPVNKQLRAYLVSLGMRAEATDQEANEYLATLNPQQREIADALKTPAAPPAQPAEGQRGEATPPANIATPPAQPVNLDAVRAEAQAAERQRQIAIRQLAGSDVPADVVERAINEGWDTARAAPVFLQAVRDARQAPPADNAAGTPPNRAPAGHVRSREQLCTRETLALSIFQRGVTDNAAIQVAAGRLGVRENWEQAAERADRLRGLRMIDICREAIRLDGREVPVTPDEVIERALSGGTLANVFTTSTHARVMAGWDEAPDTTAGWVEEVDHSDFKKVEEIDFTASSTLNRHPRGGTAKDASVSDTKEEWKIARYSKKFTLDDQDIIDDNFSILTTMPMEMGRAARRLRPDLVYALLLANPTLLRDATAVFHADHANLGTSGTALAAATLQAAIVAMAQQTRDSKTLDIRPRFLLIPQDLRFTAEILLQSAERIVASASGGTYNPLRNENIALRAENRLGTAGVTDPATGTAYTGTATNWFLTSGPGRTIKVGYLAGSGRGPQVRSFVLDRGQWGIGWDIKMDIGAAIVDYAGLYKATGAS